MSQLPQPFKESGKSLAFAKLVGSDGTTSCTHYITSTSVILGREAVTPELNPEIALGKDKTLSRHHAKIEYSKFSHKFEITCLSKNGMYVDGVLLSQSSASVPLQSRSLLQLGRHSLYFLLPAQEGALGSRGKRWRRSDRDRFKHAILAFGWGDWDRIRETVGRDRSVDDIQNFARQFVLQLMEYADSEAKSLDVLLNNLPIEDVDVVEASLLQWSALKRHSKGWARRLVDLYQLRQAVLTYGSDNVLQGVGEIRGRPPVDWWGREQDLDLLKGIHKYGFNRLDALKNDSLLGFAKKIASLRKARQEQAEVLHQVQEPVRWPPSLMLVGRFKRLVEAMRDRDEKRGQARVLSDKELRQEEAREVRRKEKMKEKEASRLQHRVLRDQERIRLKQEQAKVWTKREKDVFYKALMTHGKPSSWSQFQKAYTCLRWKTEQVLEDYFQKMLTSVVRVLEPSEEIGGKTVSVDGGMGDGDGKNEDDHVATMDFQTAYQLKQRLEFLDRIRKHILDLPDLDERLTYAEKSPDIPTWWKSNYDRLLLEGVAKHGCDNWGQILQDGLLQRASMIPKQVLVARLDYLVSLFDRVDTPQQQDILNDSKKRRRLVPGPTSAFGGMGVPGVGVTVGGVGGSGVGVHPGSGGVNVGAGHQFEELPTSPLLAAHPEGGGDVGSFPGQNLQQLQHGAEVAADSLVPGGAVESIVQFPGLAPIRYDEHAKPILPLRVNNMVNLVRLGQIVYDKPSFQTSTMLFPVNYLAEVMFPFFLDPKRLSTYMCQILDGGDTPVFQVVCPEAQHLVFKDQSPDLVWLQIDAEINKRVGGEPFESPVSGADRFGLTDLTVLKLLQDLPNANRCGDYKFRDFGRAVGRGDRERERLIGEGKLVGGEEGDMYHSINQDGTDMAECHEDGGDGDTHMLQGGNLRPVSGSDSAVLHAQSGRDTEQVQSQQPMDHRFRPVPQQLHQHQLHQQDASFSQAPVLKTEFPHAQQGQPQVSQTSQQQTQQQQGQQASQAQSQPQQQQQPQQPQQHHQQLQQLQQQHQLQLQMQLQQLQAQMQQQAQGMVQPSVQSQSSVDPKAMPDIKSMVPNADYRVILSQLLLHQQQQQQGQVKGDQPEQVVTSPAEGDARALLVLALQAQAHQQAQAQAQAQASQLGWPNRS